MSGSSTPPPVPPATAGIAAEAAGQRTMVVWCPDWPVIAAEIADGVPATAPVAVLYANRVLATSPAARAAGVRQGLRRREAQHRCPELIVLAYDEARDARTYEPVVAAVAAVAAGVQVLRPGACALAARGPVRYSGGEERAAERIIEQVAQDCAVECQVGIADGVFAAGLAARGGRVVAPGETAAFLSGLDISMLGRPELADLLQRLGITTLGAFAALPAGDVAARFGADGVWAHRLASGRDPRPVTPQQPPPDLVVGQQYDDPLARVDAAAFAARTLAEKLHERLAAHSLACTRLGIEAVTATGAALYRTWRHDGLLTAAAIADRVRWQLDGWLTGVRRGVNPTPTAGIVALRLHPEGLVTHLGTQPGLWGEAGERGERAHRAFTRVQGLLGPESVVTAVLGAGRSPADRPAYVPWGDERPPPDDAPWPGRLPAPAPAQVLAEPLPVAVTDSGGGTVTVTARLALSATPALLTLPGEPPVAITGWAGPWPVDAHWWAAHGDRLVRFQVTLVDGRALLLSLVGGHWHLEAFYD